MIDELDVPEWLRVLGRLTRRQLRRHAPPRLARAPAVAAPTVPALATGNVIATDASRPIATLPAGDDAARPLPEGSDADGPLVQGGASDPRLDVTEGHAQDAKSGAEQVRPDELTVDLERDADALQGANGGVGAIVNRVEQATVMSQDAARDEGDRSTDESPAPPVGQTPPDASAEPEAETAAPDVALGVAQEEAAAFSAEEAVGGLASSGALRPITLDEVAAAVADEAVPAAELAATIVGEAALPDEAILPALDESPATPPPPVVPADPQPEPEANLRPVTMTEVAAAVAGEAVPTAGLASAVAAEAPLPDEADLPVLDESPATPPPVDPADAQPEPEAILRPVSMAEVAAAVADEAVPAAELAAAVAVEATLPDEAPVAADALPAVPIVEAPNAQPESGATDAPGDMAEEATAVASEAVPSAEPVIDEGPAATSDPTAEDAPLVAAALSIAEPPAAETLADDQAASALAVDGLPDVVANPDADAAAQPSSLVAVAEAPAPDAQASAPAAAVPPEVLPATDKMPHAPAVEMVAVQEKLQEAAAVGEVPAIAAILPVPAIVAPPPALAPANPLDYTRAGIDYRRPMPKPKVRGTVIDFHCHLFARRHAADWFAAADHYGIDAFLTMTPLEEAVVLQRDYGHRVQFIAVPRWGDWSDTPIAWVDDYRMRLDAFYNLGSRIIKFHAAPGTMVQRGLRLDDPVYRPLMDEAVARGMAIMTHIGDPDTWYRGKYAADPVTYGSRDDHYRMWETLLERYRGTQWIGAHLGGNPEDLGRLQRFLDRFPDLMLDCSATRWMVREISARRDAAREFFIRNQDRILFGSDQVSGDDRGFDFLASRFWAHRKLWETAYIGPSSIADPDVPADEQPTLRGLALPDVVLQKMYHDNAARVLGRLGMRFDGLNQ